MHSTSIIGINWEVTEECNLACSYCYSKAAACHLSSSYDQGKDVVRWLVRRASTNSPKVHLGFFGGEPLLKWNLIRSIMPFAEGEALRAGKRVSFGIVTNGTLLNEERCRSLSGFDVAITLSLDGGPESHDRTRVLSNGQGSWRLVERNFEHIRHRFPNVKIRVTVTPQTAGVLFSNYRYLVHECGFNRVLTSPVWELDWDSATLAKFDEQMKLIAEDFIRQIEIGRAAIPLVLYNLIRLVLSRRRPEYPCGAGRSFAGLDPAGDIYPCHRFISYARDSQFRMGNVQESWSPSSLFADYSTANLRGCSGIDCSECEAQSICGGGCPAAFYAANGDIYKPLPSYQPIMVTYVRCVNLILHHFSIHPNEYFERLFASARPRTWPQTCHTGSAI